MNPLNKKASPKGGWRLEILILREGVEAGTVLVDVGEITVSEDDGILHSRCRWSACCSAWHGRRQDSHDGSGTSDRHA